MDFVVDVDVDVDVVGGAVVETMHLSGSVFGMRGSLIGGVRG